MSYKRAILSTALGAAMLAAGSSAHAALITEWSFSTTTEWTNAVWEGDVGGDTGGVTSFSSDLLSWGAAGGDFDGSELNRSALEISNDPAVGTLTTNDLVPEPTSTITHYNNRLAGGTNSLLEATIESSLTLTPLAPVPGAPFPPFTRDITIAFFETPNVSSCGFPSVSNCDDIFVIEASDLSDSFELDGFVYTVQIVAPGLGPLPGDTCDEVDAGAGCFGLTTEEDLENPIQFGLLISAREIAVPGPASLFLLGAGLVGLGAASRARKQRA